MAKHSENSQISKILDHLKQGKEISPLEALENYGSFRLGAIIHKLKQEGYSISRRMERFEKSSGKRGCYAVYRLEDCAI